MQDRLIINFFVRIFRIRYLDKQLKLSENSCKGFIKDIERIKRPMLRKIWKSLQFKMYKNRRVTGLKKEKNIWNK